MSEPNHNKAGSTGRRRVVLRKRLPGKPVAVEPETKPPGDPTPPEPRPPSPVTAVENRTAPGETPEASKQEGAAEWVRRLCPPVVGCVYYLLGDYETALDVTGETLTRLGGQPATNNGSPPETLDEARVLRAASEAARRRTRPSQVPARANDPVLAALGALPWQPRELLIWHELNGLTEEETAGLLEITPAEAFARLEQARERFAAAYAPCLPPDPALAMEALRTADAPPLPPMFTRLVERTVEKSRRSTSRNEAQYGTSWRVDFIRVTPTEGPVDFECRPSEPRKRWWIEQLRPSPRAGFIMAAGMSAVALVAVGLWNPRWDPNASPAREVPPGARAETRAKAPSAEASGDSIKAAMAARGLVEYQGEWLTPESRDERELARLMTARGYICHDGVWTDERRYLESKSGREGDTAMQAPETNRTETGSAVVQPVETNVPPVAAQVVKAEPKPEPPRARPVPEKGAGLTAQEQAEIDKAIRRLKNDLLAECLLSPQEKKRLLSGTLTPDEQRKLGKRNGGREERLRLALDKAEKKGTVPSFRATDFTFGLGEETLVGLALIKAGVSPDHPVIRRIWHDLQNANRDLDGSGLSGFTYRAGVGLMFVEAMLHSAGWQWSLSTGEDQKVRVWIKRVADDLAAAGTQGRWSYRRIESGKYDHSNTQYAALGMKAARLCGWKPDRYAADSVWRAMLDHFLTAQQKNGPPVQVKVQTEKTDGGGVNYSSAAWERSPGDGYNYEGTAEARGWGYDEIGSGVMDKTATLNMTIAGLTAIILARSEMGSLRKKDEAKTDRAIRDGMAWVQEHWPSGGFADGYGLYGIERLGVLGNLAKIGGHDWYRELAPGLATWVLSGNLGPADWSQSQCTKRAFWLLFLVRGTSESYASPVSDDRP